MTEERRKELEARLRQLLPESPLTVQTILELVDEAENRARKEAAGIVRGYVGTGPILAEIEKFWAG